MPRKKTPPQSPPQDQPANLNQQPATEPDQTEISTETSTEIEAAADSVLDAAAVLSGAASTFKVADDPELTGGDPDDSIVQLDADGEEIRRDVEPEFELMNEDQFFEQFRLIFDGPQDFDEDWAPFAIPPKEEKGARLVSDRIYRRCANSSIKWLRDFVNLNGSALLDWTMIGTFLYGRTMAVGQVMAIKQAKAQERANAQIGATTGADQDKKADPTAAHVDPNSEGAYASPAV